VRRIKPGHDGNTRRSARKHVSRGEYASPTVSTAAGTRCDIFGRVRLGGVPVTGLIDFFPDADALLALGPEDLGLILLRLVQEQRVRKVHENSLLMPLWNANTPAYPHHKKQAVEEAFAEAWQWLQNEGLLMPAPDSNGLYCTTRKGAAVRTSADLEAYRQGNLLPLALLHSRLAEKARPMFMRGDYDVAVFQAFKEVEVAVRTACKFDNDLVGTKLMRKAYDADTGPLRWEGVTLSEREAMAHLFAGAIGHCKNPQSHREVRLRRTQAAQLIVFASYLLEEAEETAYVKNHGSDNKW